LVSRISTKRHGRGALLALVLAVGASGALPAHAQDPATSAAPGATSAAAQVTVDGFRSANFGMSMDMVRKAIEDDFKLSGDKVTEGENVAERTALLTIRVDDVLRDGGPAQVSYVFGYESKTLIQVGVLWDIQSSSEAKLLANAEVLSSYFRSAGYDPATIRSSLALDNGLLIFRGEDAEGRATVLLLQGTFTDAGDQRRSLAPTALALLYAVDADNPDVFRIQSGQF
jgi:hypothetical protein